MRSGMPQHCGQVKLHIYETPHCVLFADEVAFLHIPNDAFPECLVGTSSQPIASQARIKVVTRQTHAEGTVIKHLYTTI